MQDFVWLYYFRIWAYMRIYRLHPVHRISSNKRRGTYLISKYLKYSAYRRATLKRGKCLFQRKGNQSKEIWKLLIISFQITMNNQYVVLHMIHSLTHMIYSLTYSKITCYFHYFSLYILVSYTFWFSYDQIMFRFRKDVSFLGAGLVTGRYLLEGGAYFNPGLKQCYPY